MSNHKDRGPLMFIIGILVVVAVMVLLIMSNDANAQFREQRGWQFEDPVTKAARMQREHMRQLYKGKYYDGSHANKSIYIGNVAVDEVSGNAQIVDQSNTNIGTYSTVNQSGDGVLNVDTEQDSGSQSNLNVSGQQGAGDTGGDFNGSASAGGDTMLNVGGGS